MKTLNNIAAIFVAVVILTLIANKPASILGHHFEENAVISSCRVSDRNPEFGESVRLTAKRSSSTREIRVGKSQTHQKDVLAGGSFLPAGESMSVVCGLHRYRQHLSLPNIDEDHADAGEIRVNSAPKIHGQSPSHSTKTVESGASVSYRYSVRGEDRDGNLLRVEWRVTRNGSSYSGYPATSGISGSRFNESIPIWFHRREGDRYAITARIVDTLGASDSVTWTLVVEEDDPDNPPELRRIEPRGINKILMVNQRHRFQIEARDDDEDLEVGATFSSQGRVSGSCSTIGDSGSFQSGCEYSFSDAGDYRVEATVEDEAEHEKALIWTVTVENPPAACTASRVSPIDHDLDLTEGGHHRFVVKIDCESEWDLRWHQNGSVRQDCGHNQACRITFSKRGRSKIGATLFKDGGRRTHTIIWYVTVRGAPANRAPVITASSPDSPVMINRGDSMNFSASVIDPDGDDISAQWQLDDELIPNSGFSFERRFDQPGDYKIVATFSDGRSGATSAHWTVIVEEPDTPPLACTVTRVAPVDREITLNEGDSHTFIVDINCDGWQLSWYRNNIRIQHCRDNSSCRNTFGEPGRNEIKAEFAKDDETSEKIIWTVRVEEADHPPPLNRPPQITEQLPDSPINLIIGETQTFSTSVTDPDGDVLTSNWVMNDESVSLEGHSYTHVFSSDRRSNRLSVTFTDTKGSSVSAYWQIIVKSVIVDEPPDPPPPEYPPDLEIDKITINGEDSPDRFSVGQEVRIRVSLRNDGDGTADSSEVCIFISKSHRVSSSAKPDASKNIKSIESDDDEGVTFRYQFSEEDAGDRYLVAHADCHNELDEDSENNNTGYIGTFMVSADVVPPEGNCTDQTNALIALDSSAKNWNDIIRFNIPEEYVQEVQEDFEELKRGIESKSSSYEIRHSIEDGNEIILIWSGHGREERFILCANPYGAAFSYLAPPHAIPTECKEATFDFVADQILGIIYLINMLSDAEDRNQIMEFLIDLSSINAPSYIVTGMEEPYDLMINGGDLEDLKSSYSKKLNDDFTFVADLFGGIFVSIVEPITTSWNDGNYFYAICRGTTEVVDLILTFTPLPLGKTKLATTVTKVDLIENGAKISSKGGTGIRCVALGCLRSRLQNKGFSQPQAEEIINAIAESGRDYDTVVKLIEDSDLRILDHIRNLGADDPIVKEFISGRLSGEGVFSHIDIWREFKQGGKNIKVEKTDGKADYFIPQPSGGKIIIEVKSIHSDSRLVSTLNENIEKAVEQLKRADSGLSGNRGLLIIDLRDLKLDSLPSVGGLPEGGDLYDRLEDFVHSKFEYDLSTNQGFLDNIIVIIPKKDLPEWKRVISYRYNPESRVLSGRRIDTVHKALDY